MTMFIELYFESRLMQVIILKIGIMNDSNGKNLMRMMEFYRPFQQLLIQKFEQLAQITKGKQFGCHLERAHE